jgi:DNA topoisomerase VI subunit B
LQRAVFETPRTEEYFDVRELQTMTGQPASRFAAVVCKELLDNGTDAAETAGRAPEVFVVVRHGRDQVRLAVWDNGDGIPPELVRRILDFNTRTSDKVRYRSPTRGAQGNALKTVFGIPFALGSRKPVIIEAKGVRHVVRVRRDAAGTVRVEPEECQVPDRGGTLVALWLPAGTCQFFSPRRWARAFGLFNPHTTVKFREITAGTKHANPPTRIGKFYRSTVAFPGGWRKFLPTDGTSAWWYGPEELAKLIFGHVTNNTRRGERDLTLREFVGQFKGLSSSARVKAVCDRFPGIARLSDFEANEGVIPRVLKAMRDAAAAPSPGVLGLVGEDHFRQRFNEWFGVKEFWYRRSRDTLMVVDDIPYAFEVAVAVTKKRGAFFHGVNFSPSFEDPLANTSLRHAEVAAYGTGSFLERTHAHPDHAGEHTAVAIHLVGPALQTLDKGKTRVVVPPAVAKEVARALWLTTKDLYRRWERRKKDAAREERADREREREKRTAEMTLVEAVFRVIPEAMDKASGGGEYRVSAHTLFYHVRPLVQQYTSRPLESGYFEQGLLPRYQRDHGPIPGLYYEARGTLYEPHTDQEVPLGTRDVESYHFPLWLYDKILFIEKQGLWPIFKKARFAERYDMAIVAGEGYATEACRVLFKNAEKIKDYQLFVLHDADPFGYNIARTLREETTRMPGHHAQVIDLGLKLGEALEMGLSAENFTRKKALPQGLMLTDLEREYFRGRQTPSRSWIARRVELNALTAPDLVAFVERKLQEAGVRGKVIPADDVLPIHAAGIYDDVVGAEVTRELNRLLDVDRIKRTVADELRQHVPLKMAREWVKQAFAANPSARWTGAICEAIRRYLGGQEVDLRGAVRRAVRRALPRGKKG